MKPFLSVIIPAFNESVNFKNNRLTQVYDYLQHQNYSFEIILVNDGSTDATQKLLTEYAKDRKQIRVLEEKHRGKAGTVMAGMMAAEGKYRLYTDFDQSTPIGEIEKMLPFFEKGYDVVIGSREVQGAAREREPWYRHLMGQGFNFFVQIMAVRGIHDTQCGFKIMTDTAANDLFKRLVATTAPAKDAFTGAFDVELLYVGKLRGYKIAEVPVSWKHVKTQRVNPIKDSVRMFWQLVRIRISRLCGAYAK